MTENAPKTDRLTTTRALEDLAMSGRLYAELFHHGSVDVGIYKPQGEDGQGPHQRDELYVIATGRGYFECEGRARQPVEPGEVIIVPAGVAHRFVDFTDDFSTWVFFYGPQGGEVPGGT